jgi:peroxiredoxin Q/BCP
MKNIHLILLFTLFSFLFFTPLPAQENKKALEAGDPAPHFSAVTDEGKPWDSREVIGKKIVVVYFYPAAMTYGCTKQACSYRDDLNVLRQHGIEVVGISGDYPEGLRYFREAYNLNYTLLSDPQGKVAKAFGVPVKPGGEIKRTVGDRKVTLKRGITAARWTFIIDKEGKIQYVDRSVEAAKDSKKVLKMIDTIKKD